LFQTAEALSIGEKMKDFLNRFCAEEKAKPFSPVETYQVKDVITNRRFGRVIKFLQKNTDKYSSATSVRNSWKPLNPTFAQ
jgi:hypothetical protein